jgi:hypothetical protein
MMHSFEPTLVIIFIALVVLVFALFSNSAFGFIGRSVYQLLPALLAPCLVVLLALAMVAIAVWANTKYGIRLW